MYTENRIAERRRERARRAQRRKAIQLIVLIALVLIAAVVVAARINQANADAQPVYTEPLSTIEPEMPVPIRIVESEMKSADRTEDVAAEPQELSEEPLPTSAEDLYVEEHIPTDEELLSIGYLTDDIALSYDLQREAHDAAKMFGTPVKILMAVAFKESSYNPQATNGYCWGLMQINQLNFEWLQAELSEYGVTDIKGDPVSNLRAGAYLLNLYYEKYGDWNLALMCYNCGEYGAQNQWEQGWYSSPYSRGVIAYAETLGLTEW